MENKIKYDYFKDEELDEDGLPPILTLTKELFENPPPLAQSSEVKQGWERLINEAVNNLVKLNQKIYQ